MESKSTQRLGKENKEPFDVKNEIQKFTTEFKDISFPAEFDKLEDPQKFQVITTLKNRIVDIVKSDAQTQYSEDLRTRLSIPAASNHAGHKILKGAINSLLKIRGAVVKESETKNLESIIFQNLQTSTEYKKLIEEQLLQLTQINQGRNIYIDKKTNKPQIVFDKYLDLIKVNPKEGDALVKFNEAANKFREIPYEWSQAESSKSDQAKYKKAKEEYEQTREFVLEIRMGKEKSKKGKEKGMTEMLELDNALQLDQLLNTHPEVEKEFANLANSASGNEYLKTAGNALQTITGGKGWANKLAFAAGYGIRATTKIAFVLGTAGSISLAPLTGMVIGGIKGRIRGKENLKERKIQARHGTKDESAEANKVIDAAKMVDHIRNILDELNKPNLTDSKKIALQKRLNIRIEVTQEKIEQGLLNFGNSKEALNNQFNLINKLNEALITSASFGGKIKTETDERIKNILSFRQEKISKAQKEFLYDNMRKGALIGAGFATAGYVVRWVGEEAGLWGQNINQETVKPIDKETAPIEIPKAMPPTPTQQEVVVETDTMGIEKTEPIPAEQSDFAKKLTGLEKITVDENAVVHAADAKTGIGGGITYAFKEQLLAYTELAEELKTQIGYEGKINTPEFYKAIGEHFGYIDSEGHEVRIQGGAQENIAYQFDKDADGKIIVNEIILDDLDKTQGVIHETHYAGDKFEPTTEDGIENKGTENYEYNDGREHHYKNGEDISGHHGDKDTELVDNTNNPPLEQTEPLDTKEEVIDKTQETDKKIKIETKIFQTNDYKDFQKFLADNPDYAKSNAYEFYGAGRTGKLGQTEMEAFRELQEEYLKAYSTGKIGIIDKGNGTVAEFYEKVYAINHTIYTSETITYSSSWRDIKDMPLNDFFGIGEGNMSADEKLIAESLKTEYREALARDKDLAWYVKEGRGKGMTVGGRHDLYQKIISGEVDVSGEEVGDMSTERLQQFEHLKDFAKDHGYNFKTDQLMEVSNAYKNTIYDIFNDEESYKNWLYLKDRSVTELLKETGGGEKEQELILTLRTLKEKTGVNLRSWTVPKQVDDYMLESFLKAKEGGYLEDLKIQKEDFRKLTQPIFNNPHFKEVDDLYK